MTPETTALAREMVGMPGFQWVVLMTAIYEGGRATVSRVAGTTLHFLYHHRYVWKSRDCWPDLPDPATGGVLLAQFAAWQAARNSYPVRVSFDGREWWASAGHKGSETSDIAGASLGEAVARCWAAVAKGMEVGRG